MRGGGGGVVKRNGGSRVKAELGSRRSTGGIGGGGIVGTGM